MVDLDSGTQLPPSLIKAAGVLQAASLSTLKPGQAASISLPRVGRPLTKATALLHSSGDTSDIAYDLFKHVTLCVTFSGTSLHI